MRKEDEPVNRTGCRLCNIINREEEDVQRPESDKNIWHTFSFHPLICDGCVTHRGRKQRPVLVNRIVFIFGAFFGMIEAVLVILFVKQFLSLSLGRLTGLFLASWVILGAVTGILSKAVIRFMAYIATKKEEKTNAEVFKIEAEKFFYLGLAACVGGDAKSARYFLGYSLKHGFSEMDLLRDPVLENIIRIKDGRARVM